MKQDEIVTRKKDFGKREEKGKIMLDRLVECENRLLDEQKQVNELLMEFQTGKAADELTRIKIEGMQREIDLLGRQLAVMRDAVQLTQKNAGWQVQQQRTPLQQEQMPLQGNWLQQQQGKQVQRQQLSPQAGQQQFQTAPQMQQPRQVQQFQTMQQAQAVQWQTTPPQALYRQNVPKKDFEKTFGEAVLPICASILIFISFILFAAIVLPYLNNTVKLILMYAERERCTCR